MSRANFLFTSESVSEGHPDKVSDQISDAILDAFIEKDIKLGIADDSQINTRLGCETLCTTNKIVIAGEGRGQLFKTINGVSVVDRELITEIARGGARALERVADEDVHDFLEQLLLPRLAQEPISPIAGSLLEGVVDGGSHTGLVDLGIDEITRWLRDNPELFKQVVGDKAPWWTPEWVDDKVIDWTYRQAVTWLREMRSDARHPARAALDDLLRRLAADLQHDPEVMASAESLKERLLAHPQVPTSAVAVWQSLRTSLLGAMADRESYFWRRGDELLTHLGDHLAHDTAWQQRLETHLGEVVAFFVNTYGDELAEVISVTVERWDADEASERIELFVGRDLQFIRINGTVVGALAGLAIHTVAVLIA